MEAAKHTGIVASFGEAYEKRAKALLFGGGSQRWGTRDMHTLCETEQDPGHTETTTSRMLILHHVSPLNDALRDAIFKVLGALGVRRIGIAQDKDQNVTVDIDNEDYEAHIAPRIELFGPGTLQEGRQK